ncbi:YoaK family protein [Pseudooceanicola sp. 200-1SW]|uniref:YoaK family protein n=1 Tax=Pseudooceanicola sp. 200-1SW TaxID=3425949 RepID=UPI003D7FA799
MLIHAGQDRSVSVDLRLAIWLSLAAGAVNAAGFRALGYFSANMTGNVSTLSDMMALGRIGTALWFLALLLAFILGAFVSGLLIAMGHRRRIRGIYAFSILLEALLLVLLALMDLLWQVAFAGHLMLIGLSALMGLQNAATTRISDGRVRSTHVSGLATDIGLELAALASPGEAGVDTRRLVAARLGLHLATLLAFFSGGLAGVWGYERTGPVVFLAVAALLLVLAVPQLRRSFAPGA